MGTVYRAIDPIIGRPVAIKVIRMFDDNESEANADLKARLFREAHAAGSLCHPNIVTIYQVGEDRAVAFIAMEFVEGPTLAEILKPGRPRDFSQLCRILSETAAALDFAHERGIVHRDIKPANVMIGGGGVTKVADFGIAKTLGHTVTKTGLVIGTPSYMSPEQVSCRMLDGRSDQFALAIIAYEIFTGQKPFQSDGLPLLYYQILHVDPISPEILNPNIGLDLAMVLKKGLAKDAESRYSTCRAFTLALTSAAQTFPLCAVPHTGSGATPAPVGGHLTSASSDTFDLSSSIAPVVRTRNFIPAFASIALAALTILPVKSRPQISNRYVSHPAEVHLSAPAIPNDVIRRDPTREAAAMPANPSAPPKPTNVARRSNVRPPAPSSYQRTVEPSRGVVVWSGRLAAGRSLVLNDSQASSGMIFGVLPRSSFSVKVYPAEGPMAALIAFTDDGQYVTPMTVATTIGAVTLVYDPRHATDIAIFESPTADNEWRRLNISARRACSAFVVLWSRQNL
jgi:serine/threonine protein kinase